MKTKNYTKEYLLWIIRELREEIKQYGSNINSYRLLIEEEKKKLINTKFPHNNLWKLRFDISRCENILKRDKKELRKYEIEYNRRFNPFKPTPTKRKLIYERQSWRGKSDLEVLQFCQERAKKGPDYMMTREDTIREVLWKICHGMGAHWPSEARKYLKVWPENTKVRLYYNQSESGYYVTDNYYLIEICDTE